MKFLEEASEELLVVYVKAAPLRLSSNVDRYLVIRIHIYHQLPIFVFLSTYLVTQWFYL